MPFLKRINYLGKFTSLFILTGISFALIILLVLFIEFKNYQNIIDSTEAKQELKLKNKVLDNFYSRYSEFLYAIQNNRFFNNYLEDNSLENKEDSISLFKTLVFQDRNIYQLRFIDLNGKEKIRIDRKNENIIVIQDKQLQDKKHRDYFTETIKLKENQLYLSNLNLNIENNQIEKPFKPVWRLAIPVFKEGEKKGILILNLFMKDILDLLLDSSVFKIEITDENYQVLISNVEPKNNWSKYLEKQVIKTNEKLILTEKLFISSNEILFISFYSKNWLNNFIKLINKELLLLIIFIILISIALAFYLAKVPKKLFDELEEQQKIMIQQSKLSTTGETISLITHQWRQPINKISILLQEIELKKNLDVLEDEELTKINKNIQRILAQLSNNIDLFKDFYKPSLHKNKFEVFNSINKTIEISSSYFSKFSIKCTVNCENKNLVINNFENELKQAIINIYNNSIDILKNKHDLDKEIITTIKEDKKNIYIQIQDNAEGINDDIKDKIFEPYFSTKDKEDSSGLGLYMTKIIVEKSLGGKISASNTPKGALFEITLPKS